MHPAFDKRVFDKEAISLSLAGHDISHLCPGTADQAGVHQGVDICVYDAPKGIVGRLKQLKNLYKKAVNIDADAYHCNEVDSWFIGVLLKIFHRKKCIFDVHEDYPSTFAESRFPGFIQPIIKVLVRLVFLLLIPFTDRIVLAKKTISGDFPFTKHKQVLVRNFTPLKGAEVSFNIDKFDSDEFTIVHLGLFNKKRGWPQTLDALQLMRNKNVKLIVIGTFDDGTESEFVSRASELGLSSRIEIHSWLPFEKAFEYLLNSHIGLVAFQPRIKNHIRAMPHKMFDYMAAANVVVCPDFAIEVAPFVKDSDSGILVDSSSPTSIAQAFDSVIDEPSRSKEMALNGRNAVQNYYNWEKESVELIKMYDNL